MRKRREGGQSRERPVSRYGPGKADGLGRRLRPYPKRFQQKARAERSGRLEPGQRLAPDGCVLGRLQVECVDHEKLCGESHSQLPGRGEEGNKGGADPSADSWRRLRWLVFPRIQV